MTESPAMNSDQLVIRRAVQADAEAVAEVWIRSFDAALPTVRRPRGNDRIRLWFAEKIGPTGKPGSPMRTVSWSA